MARYISTVLLLLTTLSAIAQVVPDNPPARSTVAPQASGAGSLPLLRAIGLQQVPVYSLDEFSGFNPSTANEIGVHRQLPRAALSYGRWTELPDGKLVWHLRIRSKGAKLIRVHFSEFQIGRGQVLIFGDASDSVVGQLTPYTDKGPNGDGQFWSGGVIGDEVTIEYQPEQPTSTIPPFTFDLISHVVHPVLSGVESAIFLRDPQQPVGGASKVEDATRHIDNTRLSPGSACQLDVSCYPAWRDSSRAVARLLIEKNGGTEYCTGWLINTRSSRGTPYLITNNHCVSSQADANSVAAFWGYRTPVCNGVPMNPNHQAVGGTLLTTNSNLDFTLLRLPSAPSDATFLGWSITPLPIGTSITSVHHPGGPPADWQAIAGAQIATTGPPGMTTTSERLAFWFTSGLTEQGSSGAPWMRDPGVVVGLHTSGNAQVFGSNVCTAAILGLVGGGGSWFSAIYPLISSFLEDSCSYSLSASTVNVSASGGPSSVNVSTGGGCTWSASSGVSWITINSGASGSGSGVVTFVVQANTSSASRTGNLTIAGRTITINQAGAPITSCTLSLQPSSATMSGWGGTGSFVVSTNRPCVYSAIPSVPWITIRSITGSTIHFEVDISALAFRVGTITVNSPDATAPVTFTIAQGSPGTGLSFQFVNPCRIMETRPEYNFEGRVGAFGPPFMRSGETRTLILNQSNVCNVPSSASGYILNVTLIPRGGVDYVTIWPGGEPRPTFWTIRSPDSQIVANSAIVKSLNGAIRVYSSNDADLVIDIAGYLTERVLLGDSSNTAYYPLTPCRVVDTRSEYRQPPGPFGPPSLRERETRTFHFPQTPYCSVPLASAYSMTITVVPRSPLQFLTAWPSGASRPNVSLINSPATRVLANNVIVSGGLNPTRSIDIYAFDQTDILIDINGYFSSDNGTGLYYFPVTQCSFFDTRDTSLAGTVFGPPRMQAETTRTVPIPVSERCGGVSSTAKGYVINATALPNGSPMPFLTLWPTGESRPNASVLNAFEGQVVTNQAIIPAGVDGSINVFTYRATDVVLMLSGYFARPNRF